MNKNLIAEIISVGTELLLGSTINTNAAFLGRELATLGIFVCYTTVVGDNDIRLKNTMQIALERADIIITTGGLGPTYDDLTKESIAELLDLKMKTDQHSLDRIKKYFTRNNRELTDNNLKQALLPEGAIALDNDFGTAPGLIIEYNNKFIVMLPGPPREMSPMFDNKVKPFLLNKLSNKRLFSKTINIFGIGESKIESMFANLMKESTNPTIASYAKIGEVELRVTSLADNENEAIAIIKPILEQIKEKLEKNIYGIDANSLQTEVVKLLTKKELTLSTAESCTGGYIGKRITDIDGSSKIYLGGVVSYANKVKMQLLDVKKETLKQYGAVSEQVAMEMAKGIAIKLNTDIAVSTTGIAGGTTTGKTTKPTGLVYMGYYDKRTNINYAIELQLARGYKDERESIRYLASSFALFEIIKNNR
jgi:nicotinamide-nucleotide amidase